MARAMQPAAFEDGDVIIRQGDRGRELFIIESGSVSVRASPPPTKGGADRELAKLGRGDHFGEVALMFDEPRGTTCIANGKRSSL